MDDTDQQESLQYVEGLIHLRRRLNDARQIAENKEIVAETAVTNSMDANALAFLRETAVQEKRVEQTAVQRVHEAQQQLRDYTRGAMVPEEKAESVETELAADKYKAAQRGQ